VLLTINDNIDQFIYLAESISTNEYANSLLSKSNPNDNIAIYSFNQSKGKGQIGRTWYTGDGNNLALSFIIRLNNFKPEYAQYLSMWLANVVRRFCAQLLPDHSVKVKWPNDIYVNDLKLSGLLIQSSIMGSLVKNSILGIGLNVNETDFPTELPNPVSLIQLKDQKWELMDLVWQLSSFISNRFYELSNSNFSFIKDEYLKHLYLKDQWHNFTRSSDKVSFEGKITGLDVHGNLKIESEGNIETFKFREIIF
jgi:BirA family biotin operon repressor/biotin-[acetyl-CoA-carboxylase] ligase